METTVIEFLNRINISQLIALGFMLWFFYNRLEKKIEMVDKKIDKLEEKVNDRFDKVDERFVRLENKVEDVDRRLCRIEGSLATQGSCLISRTCEERKAE